MRLFKRVRPPHKYLLLLRDLSKLLRRVLNFSSFKKKKKKYNTIADNATVSVTEWTKGERVLNGIITVTLLTFKKFLGS